MGNKPRPKKAPGERAQAKMMQRALNQGGGKYTYDEAWNVWFRFSMAMDRESVGTPRYTGMAYFWGQAYKYVLREITDAGRKRVHDAWLAAGLELTGESAQHAKLLESSLRAADRNCFEPGATLL